MEIKRYKIGRAELELKLPFHIDNTFPFSQFIVDGVSARAYKYEYSFVGEFAVDDGKLLYELADRLVYACGDDVVTYYKKYDGNGFFARRTDYAGENCGKVEYSEEYKPKLWDKSLLDTVGFERIAQRERMLIMHASFIVAHGAAVLFTAPRQTGKSTQARLWEQFGGAQTVNGDKALVYAEDDMIYASSLPYCGSSAICRNTAAELKAIIRLWQGDNKIERLDFSSAVREILKGCYLPFGAQEILDTAATVAQSVPVYSFECTPDERAVKVLENTLW